MSSSQKFIARNRAPRVQIEYDVELYGAEKKVQLPFFTYIFVNMGMVVGILPVVGVPLPLISYGGTSMVTMLLGFGILMSIQTHPKLVKT